MTYIRNGSERSKKKSKEENITVDGGVFMMDTVANIRSSSGTASELTDTTTGDSDSGNKKKGSMKERNKGRKKKRGRKVAIYIV